MEEASSSPSRWTGMRRLRSEELDFGGILRLFLRHKVLMLVLAISAIVTAFTTHILYPSYKVGATLQIRSSGANPLEAVAARVTGAGIRDLINANIYEKYFQELSSFDFYLMGARHLKESKAFEQFNKHFIEQDMWLAKWLALLRRVLLLKPHPSQEQGISERKLAVRLGEWVSYSKGGQESIKIWVTTPNPDLSLLLVNTMTELSSKFLAENEQKELDEAERYVRIQLDQAEKATKELEDIIIEFKKANNMLSLMGPGSNDIGPQIFALRREIDDIQLQSFHNERLMKTYEVEVEKEKASLDFQPDPTKKDLMSRPKYGLYRKLEELRRENQILAVRKSTLESSLSKLMQSHDPHQEQYVLELKRKMEVQSGLYQELKKQLFQMEMQRIIVRNKVRPFEKAQDFEIKRSVSLKKKLSFALLIAFLIGGFSAYVWEILVPTVRTRQDLDDLKLSFLGGVPDLSRRPHRNRQFQFVKLSGKNLPPLCRFDVDSSASMSFKYIRSRVQHIVESQTAPLQIIAVVSYSHSEGKSFIASNFAACIAYSKRRTLLIDCDLRKSTTSEIFKVAQSSGLNEVLKGTEKFGSVVKQNILPRLDVLPGGTFTQDITEMIGSDQFTELLSDLRTLYDYIILDTPPLSAVPDSALIAKHSDLMVLVASANKTTIENVERAMNCISDFGAKHVYAVLNKVEGAQDYIYIVPGYGYGKVKTTQSGGQSKT